MRTIYKYPIQITDEQEIEMPTGAILTHADLDPHGAPCVWAAVDTDKPMGTVTIMVFGTGNALPLIPLRPIGTFRQGPFMWHVFMK